MIDYQIRCAMARIEGYYEAPEDVSGPMGVLRVNTWHKPDGSNATGLMPDYLNDHNACQRVVDVLDRRYQWEYSLQLQILLFVVIGDKSSAELTLGCLQATPRQKCEAILKAKGLWL